MTTKPGSETPKEEPKENQESPGKDPELEDISQLVELQKMVTQAAEAIEERLAGTLKEAIESINAKIELNAAAAAEVQGKVKIALEAAPQLIQDQVEKQLRANLTGIVEEVGNQFEKKVKAMAGGDGSEDGSGIGLRHLLANSDKIIGIINAWRSPTTDQAMMAQMNFVMRWHSLLSKLEKGGGSGEDFTKAIAETFNTEKPE